MAAPRWLLVFGLWFIVSFIILFSPLTVSAQDSSQITFCSDNKTVSLKDSDEPNKSTVLETCENNQTCQTISSTKAECGGSLRIQQSCDPEDDQCGPNLSCQEATVDTGVTEAGQTYCFSDTSRDGQANPEAASNPDAGTGAGGATDSTTTPQPPGTPSRENWDANKQTTFTFNNIVGGISCLATGLPFGTDGCPQTVFTKDGPKTLVMFNGEGGGALGASTHFIAQMYNNQPASGVQYVASIIRDFDLAPEAYAQVGGSGAAVIAPVQRIWQISRNIAYLGFTLIFVVAGFMIIFRQRLSQQAVVSIQAALPGLIVGLILVTFSYFISGLIIDLAFVGSQVIGIIFLSQVGGDGNAVQHVQEILNNQNVVTLFSRFVFSGDLLGSAGVIGNSVTQAVYQNTANRVVIGILGALAACLNPAALGAIASGTLLGAGVGGLAVAAICAGGGFAAGAGGGGIIVSGIVYLILLFGLLQAMFRLLFSLIGAYVTVITTTIFAPFIILFSAVPGQGGLVGLWWRSLLANVLIFPVVFGLFLLVATILGNGDLYLNPDPPVIGEFNQSLPLFGGSPVNFVQLLLAYGLLLASPGIPDLVRELLKARPNQIIGNAIRGGVQGGANVTQTTMAVAPTIVRGVAPTATRVGGWIRNIFR